MQTSEEWREVPDSNGIYEVSNLGRVRSLDRYVYAGPKAGRRIAKGKILQQQVDDLGRCKVGLVGMEKENWRVHRLVAIAFLGLPDDPTLEVCHIDGNASNNALSNLRWDTRSSNNYDLVKHGAHSQASKEVCPRGHRLESPNLVESTLKRGSRECKACHRARSLYNYYKSQGRAYDFELNADLKYEKIMNN